MTCHSEAYRAVSCNPSADYKKRTMSSENKKIPLVRCEQGYLALGQMMWMNFAKFM